MKFKMELTLQQLRVIEEALNVFSRIGIAQIEVVGDVLSGLFPKQTISRWYLKEQYFDKMKSDLFGLGDNTSYGIACKEVHDTAKIAYDLQKTVQKVIATENNHHSMSVWHHGNILHLGSEPIAKITKEK